MPEKEKRKRTFDPWWHFPQSFYHKGEGSLEDLLSHLRGYHQSHWQGGQLTLQIEEVEADFVYRVIFVYDKQLTSGHYQASLSGRISQYPPNTFIIEGTSVVELSGLTNLALYMLLVIFVTLPVIFTAPLPSTGLALMLILSMPLLFPLSSHLQTRRNIIQRFTDILRHFTMYEAPMPLPFIEQSWHSTQLNEDAESLFVFEDGILKEKRDT